MFMIIRGNDENWRQTVERYARVQCMEMECLATFDALVSNGTEERQAAWNSLYEWDCVPCTV